MSRRRASRAASIAGRSSNGSRQVRSCNGPARPTSARAPYEGKREGGFQFRLFHGLTPETETSCFYFWSCANGYRQNEPEATEQLYREIAPTFVEDKDMVEAQQARLDELGEQGLVNIVSDANRVIMRRFIERLLAEERGALAAE